MAWLSGVPAIACLVAGVLHLARLAVRRRDVAAELSHAAMGLGMAAMASPLGDPVPGPVWTVVFVFCAAWFAAVWCYRALRRGTSGGDAVHHVVASGAMLFMLAVGHRAPAVHGVDAVAPLGPVSVVAVALTGYFAWHALRCADRCRRSEPTTAGAAALALRAPIRSITTPQLAAAAHLVMAVVMAGMLLGLV